MLFETPVVLFVIASLTAIVVFLLLVLLNQNQKKLKEVQVAELENLKRFLLVDPQTGAYNQSFFVKKLEEESYRAARYNSHFTVAIFNFDGILNNLDEEKAASIFRKLVASAIRDTRYSDFVASIGTYSIGVIFSMTSKASSEVPVNRLLVKFSETLRQEKAEGEPATRILSFPEDKTEIEKIIRELKE